MAPAALLREVTTALCKARGALGLEELRRHLRAGVCGDMLAAQLQGRRGFALGGGVGGRRASAC